ncbi:MAG: RNA polymerase sigma factor FliA [Succinivibrionaceae bacterium]
MLNPLAAYKKQQDPREDIVVRFAPLVKRIALHLKARLPESVQLDDMMQVGMIGLLDASQNYTGAQGASFETYASIRIRGAMLDELRKNDWAPRNIHKTERQISEVMSKLSHKFGRNPTDEEMSVELKVSLDEYHKMVSECSSCRMIGIEDLGVTNDVIEDCSGNSDLDPYKNTSREKFHKHLVNAIKQLPEREQLILSLYYDQELNLKEIGAVLSVSESRASQILSQTVLRLKSFLKDWN